MLTTILIGGVIVTGLAVAARMVRDSENNLEHHHKLIDVEQEIEQTKNKVLFEQF
jgi:hypothetical protein